MGVGVAVGISVPVDVGVGTVAVLVGRIVDVDSATTGRPVLVAVTPASTASSG